MKKKDQRDGSLPKALFAKPDDPSLLQPTWWKEKQKQQKQKQT